MYPEIPRITEEKIIPGTRILLRSELNVPVIGGEINDDFRIRKSLQTISWLKARGARIIILAHRGQEPTDSLEPVYAYLKELMEIIFVKDIFGNEGREASRLMNNGDVILFENIRQHPGEKENNIEFARQLSEYGDMYVNDAFSVSHRPHASIIGIPQYLPSYAGIQFIEELENLSRSFNPPHPFLFVLGGAKFETKVPLIEKFLSVVDHLFVAGALSNFFFSQKGFEVGISLLPTEALDLNGALESEKIILPRDVVVKNKEGRMENKYPEDVGINEDMVEIGPQSLSELKELVSHASFILWNGPLGKYEEGFQKSTEELASAIALSTAESIVGGGDTLAAIDAIDKEETFSFISTAGGAMLEFLSNETLPGIDVLRR